jgi:threonine dehydrogenase-like Zn-dependent dehydrogenase
MEKKLDLSQVIRIVNMYSAEQIAEEMDMGKLRTLHHTLTGFYPVEWINKRVDLARAIKEQAQYLFNRTASEQIVERDPLTEDERAFIDAIDKGLAKCEEILKEQRESLDDLEKAYSAMYMAKQSFIEGVRNRINSR